MSATRSRGMRVLPAAALLGAAVVALPAAPAHAASCAPGTGVTVVVEFGDLGGGTSVLCDPGGAGDPASTVTERVGFSLDYVASQPGFVCRVDGKPASDPCQRTPPSNAYWGLFWSDGKGGWKYSSAGARALEVPAGGSIGWRWQDGGGTDQPSTAPNQGSAPKPEPEPKPQPEPQPGRDEKPGRDGTTGGEEGQREQAPDEPTPSDSPSPKGSGGGDRPRDDAGRDARSGTNKGKKDRERQQERPATEDPADTASVEPSDETTDAVAPVSDDTGGDGSDATLMLVAGAAVLLLASAAGVTAWRRRS